MPQRQNPVADFQLVAVAQGRSLQTVIDLDAEDGQIGRLIASDVFRTILPAVGQLDRDFVGPLDHVIIGEDYSLGIDDDAGAKARPSRHFRWHEARRSIAAKVPEALRRTSDWRWREPGSSKGLAVGRWF